MYIIFYKNFIIIYKIYIYLYIRKFIYIEYLLCSKPFTLNKIDLPACVLIYLVLYNIQEYFERRHIVSPIFFSYFWKITRKMETVYFLSFKRFSCFWIWNLY